jgi:hypothetical protein
MRFLAPPLLERRAMWASFQSAEKIVTATREAIQDLPANIFKPCFQQLYQGWQACIEANCDYFEGGCGYE